MITTDLANQFKKIFVDGFQLVAFWTQESLWGNNNYKGLGLLSNGKWTTVEVNSLGNFVFNFSCYTKEYLVSEDGRWGKAFNKIDSGLVPFFADKQCSCGASKIYGDSWPYHSNECYINEPGFSFLIPKNNDGRSTCWVCGNETVSKPCWNSLSNLCNNKKCTWYDR